MQHDEKHVITGNAIVVWDGVTRPQNNDQGKMVHSLKVALLPGAPELAELDALAKAALAADATMKGNLPTGGHWPVKQGLAGEIDPVLVGHTAINTKTYNGAPQVFDTNGRELQPMEYGPMLYAGAVVKLVISAYSYTNIQKGVAFNLDAIQIVDATTPKLSIAAGFDATGVFGAATPPMVPDPNFLAGPGATPAPPAAPVPPAKTMTAKAAGQTYDQFIMAGWTDSALIAEGYLIG